MIKRVIKVTLPVLDLFTESEAYEMAENHAIRVAEDNKETNEHYNEYVIKSITRDKAATDWVYFIDVYYFHVSAYVNNTTIL